MALRARSFVSFALLAAASAVACDEDCSSLDDCDGEECQVIRGAKLTGSDPRGSLPAGCVAAGTPAGDLQTHARAPDGACWVFSTTLVPDDFTPDDSCKP
jgi:hypothetical protein